MDWLIIIQARECLFNEKYMFKFNYPPHQPYLHQFFIKSNAVTCIGLPQVSSIYWSEGSMVSRRGRRRGTQSYKCWSSPYCPLISFCMSLWNSPSQQHHPTWWRSLENDYDFSYVNFLFVEPIKCTICMKNSDFSPFYILCLTVLRDIPGVTSES